MTNVFIVSAARTAIGKFQGTLAPFTAPKLGVVAATEAIARSGVSVDRIDEVIFGNVLGAGLGQNPARQVALGAGVPNSVGAFTVNKVCGSGLKAVMLAAQAIRAGDGDCILAGGAESMSNAPYLLPGARVGSRMGHMEMKDAMIVDGLWDVTNDFHMGNTAELVCQKYNISRRDQDEHASASHAKANEAIREGRFDAEIVATPIKPRKGDPYPFLHDEGPREDTGVERLGSLRPAFSKEGSVTAGNASQISDGAAAVMVASEAFVTEHGLTPLARIINYTTGGCAPEWVMMAPMEAIGSLLARDKKTIRDYDLIEVNEAFSSAAVALQRELNIPPERLNVNGGAIALGHPIGCTGARMLTTLLYAMHARDAKTGLASLCLGGGNAVAMSLERV